MHRLNIVSFRNFTLILSTKIGKSCFYNICRLVCPDFRGSMVSPIDRVTDIALFNASKGTISQTLYELRIQISYEFSLRES